MLIKLASIMPTITKISSIEIQRTKKIAFIKKYNFMNKDKSHKKTTIYIMVVL